MLWTIKKIMKTYFPLPESARRTRWPNFYVPKLQVWCSLGAQRRVCVLIGPNGYLRQIRRNQGSIILQHGRVHYTLTKVFFLLLPCIFLQFDSIFRPPGGLGRNRREKLFSENARGRKFTCTSRSKTLGKNNVGSLCFVFFSLSDACRLLIAHALPW